MRIIIVLRTPRGQGYAKRLGAELRSLAPDARVPIVDRGELQRFLDLHPACTPSNTVIHARAADPRAPWMQDLARIERNGFRIINRTHSLELACDNYLCAKALGRHGIRHAETWHLSNDETARDSIRRIMHSRDLRWVVVKPRVSQGQGLHVHRLSHAVGEDDLTGILRSIPDHDLVMQEFVPYTGIYRVIVLGGRPVPISFVDRPTGVSWKVPVCLNDTSMRLVPKPDDELLEFAVKVQEAVQGEINFVDVFETRDGYVVSEINTACSFLIHERLARTAGHSHWNLARSMASFLLCENEDERSTAFPDKTTSLGQSMISTGDLR